MRLLYDQTDGTIYHSVYDRDWFAFTHETNIPLTEFVVDELAPDNKGLCHDIVRTTGRVDSNGLGKYYMNNGQLMERTGWQVHVEGPVA